MVADMPTTHARRLSMTESELQEEVSILNLSCGQLGNELAQGRLAVAQRAYATLGSILKKYVALGELAQQHAKCANGQAETGQSEGSP